MNLLFISDFNFRKTFILALFPALLKANLFSRTSNGLHKKVSFLRRIVKFKYSLTCKGDFPGLFKANSIFKDFSRKPSISKYFSSLLKTLLITETDENPYSSGLQIRVCIGKLFSLFLIQTICCGYSKEPSQ